MIIIPPRPKTTTDVRALVFLLTDACNRHDPDEAVRYYTEDAVVTFHATGQRLAGRPAIREELARTFAAFPDLHIEKTSFVVQDDRFADEFVHSGTSSGAEPDVPAGRSFRMTAAGLGRVRGGRIVRHDLYWNALEQLTQLGVLPVPAEAADAPAIPLPR